MNCRSLIALVAISVSAIGLSACTKAPSTGETAGGQSSSAPATGDIVLGMAVAQSGWMAAYDAPAEKMARLAAENINAAGGVDGRKIVITVQDTKTDQQTAATAAQELIAKGAQVILASGDFDEGSPAALAAQAENVVSISVGAASPRFGLQGIGPMAFTMGSPTPQEGSTGSEWAYGQKGWHRGAFMCDDSIEYSVSLCKYAQEGFKLVGGEVVSVTHFQQNDASFASQIAEVAKSGADFVYLGSYLPGGVSVIRQLRDSGVDLPIVTGAAMEGTDWLASNPNLNNVFLVVDGFLHGEGDTPELQKVLQQYQSEFGESPETATALAGYAAVEVVADALRNNGGDTSGPALQTALEKLTDVPTIVGPTTFTPEYHFSQTRKMAIVEIKDGKMGFVERYAAPAVPTPEF